jgi:hypothetical protein
LALERLEQSRDIAPESAARAFEGVGQQVFRFGVVRWHREAT